MFISAYLLFLAQLYSTLGSTYAVLNVLYEEIRLNLT